MTKHKNLSHVYQPFVNIFVVKTLFYNPRIWLTPFFLHTLPAQITASILKCHHIFSLFHFLSIYNSSTSIYKKIIPLRRHQAPPSKCSKVVEVFIAETFRLFRQGGRGASLQKFPTHCLRFKLQNLMISY